MNLYLYYPNLESYKKSFKNLFETKSFTEVKRYLRALEYETEQVSFQYQVQYEAIWEIRKLYWDNANLQSLIYWFYFWNDTCEFLIPSLDELKEFIWEVGKFSKQDWTRKRTISLITPPLWNFWVKKLEILLEYLNNEVERWNKNLWEIIINDYWTLNLIQEKYKNLKPVLWRLFNKAQRNPVMLDAAHPQVPAQLWKKVFDKIKWNQEEYYHSNPLDLDVYRDSFKNICWIDRFWLDHVWMWLKEEVWANWNKLDLYFPYALTACWRNCATRWIHEKTGEWYMSDLPCQKYCKKYDVFLKDWLHKEWITQRWNAVWQTYASFQNVDESILKNWENRLIFEAFIPI